MINDGDKTIRSRMGDMEAGAELIPFDKEAAWMRLHERMAGETAGKGRRLPFRWLAIAAALLLLASAILLLKKPETRQIAAYKVRPKTVLPAQKAPPQQTEPVLASKSIIQPPVHEAPKRPVKAEQPLKAIVAAPVPIVAPAGGIVSQCSLQGKADVIAQAPKMKVIHINELVADEERERMEQWQSKQYVSGSRSYFSFIKPANGLSLFENDPSPQPLKIRFK